MKNGRLKNFIFSGTVTSALILSLSVPSAFATENVTEQEDSQETATEAPVTESNNENVSTEGTAVLKEEPTTKDDTVVGTEEKVPTEVAENEKATEEALPEDDAAEETDQDEEPSLVPGDFFYFVKIMMEKVKLAVIFEDYEEARLLADFAAERIKEANALFADGKTEEAEELLKEAIAIQEKAAENLADSGEIVTEEAELTDAKSEEIVAEEVSTKLTEENVVEIKLAKNIDSLAAALSHVKNPTAQQALMKNIQKSFAKLDKRLAKLEQKAAKFTTEEPVAKQEEETKPAVDDTVEKETTNDAQPEKVTPVIENQQKAETNKQIAQTKKVENQQKAETNKQVAQTNKVENQQKAETNKQVAQTNKVENQQKAETNKQVAQTKKVENQQKAESNKQVSQTKKVENQQKAEANKQVTQTAKAENQPKASNNGKK
ncbi:DUF5667 domain-containing protein [Metabacillus niabensis]|uniref:DUF5667 domain-containing protein n=1 Tax=Metabacillus niabensis TaxID=324854 RepID=A0ABT9Z6H4_9BACI|nr:DUF5667 domain-containing protein [Metabacillus niabensis]MDQ0227851.1 hypothetical protein [Metabacillus niabensis]